jgi:pre-mRNA-processing factor 8
LEPPPNAKRALLAEKAHQWRQLNQKRFAAKTQRGFVQPQKEEMPPEHLRKVRFA